MKNRILVNVKAARLDDACNVVTVNADELISVLQEKLENGLVMFSYQQDGVTIEAFGTRNPELIAIFELQDKLLYSGLVKKACLRAASNLNTEDEDNEILQKVKDAYVNGNKLNPVSAQTFEYFDVNLNKEIVFNKNLLINVHV